ncbi:MAG: tRNA (adenosine(37)-N6)-threonylcarbamoyltransferase complex ATPase subunit type 1 TsaE [bacterium]
MATICAVVSRSPEQTGNVGELLARHLQPGDIIAFFGELGAGKTCMIQGICRGLGVPKRAYITSPTFVLMNRYQGRLPIYHFDFYRLACEEEIIGVGYEEFLFGEGVSLIEWADRAGDLLPEECMQVRMQVASPTERRIDISAGGEGYEKRLSMWRALTDALKE